MTAAREIGNADVLGARTMHMRGHTSDLALNAELYATQLEVTVDDLSLALFGPRPRDTDASPNVKPIPPQSLMDELIRLDNAIGRIGTAYKLLAEIRDRIQPNTEGGATASYPDAEPPRTSAPGRYR